MCFLKYVFTSKSFKYTLCDNLIAKHLNKPFSKAKLFLALLVKCDLTDFPFYNVQNGMNRRFRIRGKTYIYIFNLKHIL